MVDIDEQLKSAYPFQTQFCSLKDPKQGKLSYIRSGKGQPVVFVHGNPTWSFFFREPIKHLAKNGFEGIAVDHLGCGLSDKPEEASYTLKARIDHFEQFIDCLNLSQPIHLVVHDWGGAIGLGYATRFPEKIASIVIMNTAAFTDTHIPKRIKWLKDSKIGPWLIEAFNLFAWPATYMASSKGLSNTAKTGLLFPYRTRKARRAIAEFVRDIPLKPEHTSYAELKRIETDLCKLKEIPKVILWGKQDFCFDEYYLKKWLKIFPDTPFELYPDCGHYLLEDNPKHISQTILHFLKKKLTA